MSWSAAFAAQLEALAATPVWILESVVVGGTPGSALRVSSADGYGDVVAIAEDGVRIAGQVLAPATWMPSTGLSSVDVVDLDAITSSITRGTIVRILLGWVEADGTRWIESDFEAVMIGQVRGCSQRGRVPRWTIEINDIFAALRSNFALSRSHIPLFYNTATARAVATADYAVGAASVDLDATTDVERETGGNGALRVEVTTPFYLLWSSVAGTTYTLTGAASEHFATTRDAAPVGTVVYGCAYLRGAPADIVRRLLVSGGGGGGYDTYPASWAWGLPDGWIDHADCDAWRDQVLYVSSGSYTWEIVQAEPVDDGLAWISEKLSRAGLFLALRQGQITVRAGQSFLASAPFVSDLTLTDEDIIDVLQWDAFDPGATEACMVTATATTHANVADSASSSEENAATLPAVQTRTFDQTGLAWSNTTNILSDDIVPRLTMASLRVPEVLRLRVTLRFAQLAIGDLLPMEVTKIRSRITSTGVYTGLVALVTEASPDYTRRYCDVRLHVYAGTDDVFPP